jgi:hypothetical protein
MRLQKPLISALLLSTVEVSTFGQGSIIIQHSGSANPTAEGFSFASDGTASVGASGTNAWNTTIGSAHTLDYSYSLTPQQQNETFGTDWILSFTLQSLESGGAPNAFVGLNSSPVIYIGSEANGDPFVDGTPSNPVFVLNGGGDGYHNYQLIYTTTTGDVALWIDGTEQISDLFSGPATGISEVEFGESQGGPASDNWSLVSFGVVPEPSSLALIFLGSGVSIYVRTRNKKLSTPFKLLTEQRINTLNQ